MIFELLLVVPISTVVADDFDDDRKLGYDPDKPIATRRVLETATINQETPDGIQTIDVVRWEEAKGASDDCLRNNNCTEPIFYVPGRDPMTTVTGANEHSSKEWYTPTP